MARWPLGKTRGKLRGNPKVGLPRVEVYVLTLEERHFGAGAGVCPSTILPNLIRFGLEVRDPVIANLGALAKW